MIGPVTVKVGWADDPFSMSTRKYRIVAETTDGRYVVMEHHLLKDYWGSYFLSSEPLLLLPKRELQDIREETVLV